MKIYFDRITIFSFQSSIRLKSIRSAPELCSLWNPSLRKTLSHPPAHLALIRDKTKNSTSSTNKTSSSRGSSQTSKSVRIPNSGGGHKNRSESMMRPRLFGQQQSNRNDQHTKKNNGSGNLSKNNGTSSTISSKTSAAMSTEQKTIETSPLKEKKKSLIFNFKKSFKSKRSDLFDDINLMPRNDSSQSFTMPKKSSLTSEYLAKINPSIRRWSDQTASSNIKKSAIEKVQSSLSASLSTSPRPQSPSSSPLHSSSPPPQPPPSTTS